jgi:hypothetical protein
MDAVKFINAIKSVVAMNSTKPGSDQQPTEPPASQSNIQ